MDLKQIVNNMHTVIYGVGKRARVLSETLMLAGIINECYVVSDEEPIPDEQAVAGNVLHISKWYKNCSGSKDRYLFLIAVDPKYFSEIMAKLDSFSLLYVCVEDKDVQQLYREQKPIDESCFCGTPYLLVLFLGLIEERL